MMKSWEIRKLGELGAVVGGSTPKTNVPSYWGEGYYWITPAELDGSKYVGATARTITDEALKHTNLSLLPVGTVLLSSRAPIGKVAITTVPMYCNQGFKNIICGPDINNEYVYWFLIHNKDYLVSLGRGATFKEISKHIVEQVFIPVPPLNEQVKVAAELNCLSNIIEKKKQQLEELDKLAQSIFYDMFGDPITNEKGWEVIRLNDLCEITSSKRIYANEYVDSGVPFFRGKEITEKSKGNSISVELFINQSRYDELKRKFGVPQKGDLLLTAVGTIGNIWEVDTDDPFYFKDGNVLWLHSKEKTNSTYFKYLLSVLIEAHKREMANGCAYNALTIVNLKEMPTNLVPLNLQELFAQKVEAIEKEKELVKQSIVETETLFNSRMDYWFN